jgi:hypothetical protein
VPISLSPLSAYLCGESYKSRVLAPEIRQSDEISSALRIIRSRWPEKPRQATNPEKPIFLLSAGWGSGSTLLQRLITSSGNTLLWGEPHDHAIPLHRLAQMLTPISDRWPRDSYFSPGDEDKPLHMQWIANYSPQISSLKSAHLAFIREWLMTSAQEHQCQRWGLKEVRLTIDHARYLQWLFPDAKFVFIYRDVLKSYRSCKGVRWLSVWPNYRVSQPGAFAHHWNHLLTGFLKGASDVDGMLIKYEDLVAGDFPLEKLSDYLQTDAIDESFMGDKIGARGSDNRDLSFTEKTIIQTITRTLRQDLGYT